MRSTTFNELPELYNTLKGDMSIICPRPQLVKDMVFMTFEQRQRHSVLPGLSGLAQVNGRNDFTWEEKLALDLEYIEYITSIGDCKIILKTLVKISKREGISADGLDTAEDFRDYLLRLDKIKKHQYYIAIEKIKQLIRY